MEETFSPPSQTEIKEELETLRPKGNKLSFLEKFWYILVVLVCLALAGVATLWALNQNLLPFKTTSETTASPSPIASPTPEGDTATEALENQGSSDEIDEIEADLKATDLDNLDEEVSEIENEFNSL